MAQATRLPFTPYYSDSLARLKGKLFSKLRRLNQHILLADHFCNNMLAKKKKNYPQIQLSMENLLF